MILLATAGILFILSLLKTPKQMWFSIGLILCLGFSLILHTIYGDDPLLYSPNWVYALVLFVALSLQRWANQKWLQITMIVFLSLMMIVNLKFDPADHECCFALLRKLNFIEFLPVNRDCFEPELDTDISKIKRPAVEQAVFMIPFRFYLLNWSFKISVIRMLTTLTTNPPRKAFHQTGSVMISQSRTIDR